MSVPVLALLLIYQIKHFAADYPLQTSYMLGKGATGWGFVAPLALHAGVHAGLTLAIALAFSGRIDLALALAVLDGFIHFGVDRLKAAPKYLGRWGPADRRFWWSLGADQAVHHVTHILIVYVLVVK